MLATLKKIADVYAQRAFARSLVMRALAEPDVR